MKTKTKKVANKANNTTTGSTTNLGSLIKPKTALYVGLGALAIFIGYKIYRGVNYVGDVFYEDPKTGGGDLGDINNPSKIPNGATISLIQAQTTAANILSVVDGFGGLNEKEYLTLETALRGKTAKDYQMISEAFGTPKRSPITGEQSFWFFGEKLNLSQWLTIEMDDDQKARLRIAAPLIF